MSREVRFVVEEEGQRADKLLAQEVEELTRSAAQQLLAQGLVTCEGRPLGKSEKLKAGREIVVVLPDAQPLDVQAQDIPLDIVYEDGDLLVVNKPKGMVVHPAPGNPDGTLVNALLYHCGESLSGINGVMRPGTGAAPPFSSAPPGAARWAGPRCPGPPSHSHRRWPGTPG